MLNPSNIDYKTRTFNDAVKHDHIVLESMKNADNDYPSARWAWASRF